MAIKAGLFFVMFALASMFSTQGAVAQEHPTTGSGEHPTAPPEHPTATPDGLPGAPDFDIEVVEFPSFEVAVMEGTLGGDIDALFGSMFEAVGAQGLFNDDTSVGSVFPYAMAKGWDGDTVILVGVSLAENAEVSEPLEIFEIPGGAYLMVMNIGPYEETEASWTSTFAWAGQHGIELGTGPAFQRYLDDPAEVAAEVLRTEIYIPLVAGQSHPEGHEGHVGEGHGDKHEEHGEEHPSGTEEHPKGNGGSEHPH